MKQKVLFTDIDFADSEYRSCEMEDTDFTVYLNSWDGKTIRIIFHNTIQFSYKIYAVVSYVCEITEKNSVLDEALALRYEKIPNDHPYKLFQIIDIDDVPFIEVVAEGAQAFKE